MLLVKIYVDVSTIPGAGLGLFAGEPLAEGTVIWREHALFDLTFTQEQLEKLGRTYKPAMEKIESFAWFDGERNLWVLPGDNARFMNHSETPNCDDSELYVTKTNRFIDAGEELTIDYRVFHTGDLGF